MIDHDDGAHRRRIVESLNDGGNGTSGAGTMPPKDRMIALTLMRHKDVTAHSGRGNRRMMMMSHRGRDQKTHIAESRRIQ